MTRIFQGIPLQEGNTITLDALASRHLVTVLRARVGDKFTVFNGEGGEYSAMLSAITKKTVMANILQFHANDAESPLDLILAQGISRGTKMDYTIQKAVELGVKTIIPLFTERCNVKLDDERREKRFAHWQAIVTGACEQSGRNRIPDLLMPDTLPNRLPLLAATWRFVLSPTATSTLKEHHLKKGERIVLMIGPEGGFSETEIRILENAEFIPLHLGPRILRTETAAVAAMSALQCVAGDMQ